MARDLLSRADDLVAKTDATRRELVDTLDHLDRRLTERKEYQRALLPKLESAAVTVRLWIAICIVLASSAMIVVGAMSGRTLLSLLAGLAVLAVGVVGFLVRRYETILQYQISLIATRRRP